MPETLLAGLLPELATLARAHRIAAQSKGISFVFTSGHRTAQKQMEEWAKGRKLDLMGIWHVEDPALVVTNALPSKAPHCRGAAYDLVPIVNEKAAWDRLDLFQVLGELGEQLGLVWGGRWPRLRDLPHFEIPGWRSLPIKE